MNKRKFYLVVGVPIMLGSLISINYLSALISQEGNPIPFAIAITKLYMVNEEMIKVREEPAQITYISKTSSGNTPFINFMVTKGYQFKEQLGAGYLFEKDGKRLIASSRQYTGHFKIWHYQP